MNNNRARPIKSCRYKLARVLVLIASCGVVVQSLPTALRADAPTEGSTRNRFESEIEAFEKWDRKNTWPKDGILFVGSSSIRLWQTAEAFSGLPVLNRGFGGSTISDVNHFYDRIVSKYKPRVIVFYAGDNDIAGGKSAKQVFDDFQRFVAMTHEQLPKTGVLFLSIKPSLARKHLWPKMIEANTLIRGIGDASSQVQFVDVATPMLNGRDLPPKSLFLDDGLHLTADGYRLWNKALAPFLAGKARTAVGQDK